MAPDAAGTLPPPPRATAVIVIGMAGSGKSTFVSRLASHLGKRSAAAAAANADPSTDAAQTEHATRPYIINIDPAVRNLGYSPNVDIRDTVDYRRVMEEYHLGPNGGILTALNLFTTKFDQVLQLAEKRANDVDEILLDTPGQIEIFTWSASGSIITDALASAMPTVVAYVVDTPRTTAPATFMSNMLYACSIMYKARLPFVLVFNKTDVQSDEFARKWMQDFEAFQKALALGNARDPSIHATQGVPENGEPLSSFMSRGEEPSYINSLMNSMSLVLDEFYKNLRAVGVSSATGAGMDEFLEAVQDARKEYLAEYRPEMERLLKEKSAQLGAAKESQMKSLLSDMRLREPRSGISKARDSIRVNPDKDAPEEPEYTDDGQIVDPDSDEERAEYGAPGGDDRRSKQWNKHDGTYWPTPTK
ncbi:hypothetical protein MVES1_000132 [Malassezia vespertilionis]|uniref:GPN-loop GTPase n=1 Tax=Malassezia vespertilionis TaxID=2020962 RepID=A0A2N1JFN3_9BASI|nr:uncharacterized protein MVES1_000132 [Malassezia vespertilionis]PKI85346.1 hypothetical protein MVES_000131 [Malassezia vespertilionis]WFD04808.1 hypothetical protein MVES1_000132 [Malassezia vespertilionis]